MLAIYWCIVQVLGSCPSFSARGQGLFCGWPFNEALVVLVTTLSVAFPCIQYYSMEALAEHALAIRHQHLWCLTTVVLHVVSVLLTRAEDMVRLVRLWPDHF